MRPTDRTIRSFASPPRAPRRAMDPLARVARARARLGGPFGVWTRVGFAALLVIGAALSCAGWGR